MAIGPRTHLQTNLLCIGVNRLCAISREIYIESPPPWIRHNTSVVAHDADIRCRVVCPRSAVRCQTVSILSIDGLVHRYAIAQVVTVGESLRHCYLPQVVIASSVALRQIVEEAQYSEVFVVQGEEVAVRRATPTTVVEHPLPSVFRRYVGAEIHRQVADHRSVVPRQVDTCITLVAIFVLDALAHTVVDVDGLLLAPLVYLKVLVVDVIGVGFGSVHGVLQRQQQVVVVLGSRLHRLCSNAVPEGDGSVLIVEDERHRTSVLPFLAPALGPDGAVGSYAIVEGAILQIATAKESEGLAGIVGRKHHLPPRSRAVGIEFHSLHHAAVGRFVHAHDTRFGIVGIP